VAGEHQPGAAAAGSEVAGRAVEDFFDLVRGDLVPGDVRLAPTRSKAPAATPPECNANRNRVWGGCWFESSRGSKKKYATSRYRRLVNDERDVQGDDRDGEGPAGRPELPRRLVYVGAAALVAGGLIESTRRAVRSAVSTVRRWLHLT